MHTFKELIKLTESTSQEYNSDYQKLIGQAFKYSNTGKIKRSGLKRLMQQIKDDKLNYCGFPEFVLKSWKDPSKIGCLPLKNNLWLDVQNVVGAAEEALENQNLTYAGIVVDSARKSEYGIQAISLVTSHDIDLKKYAKLLKFKLVANEAQKLLDKINKQEALEEQAPEAPQNTPATPSSTKTTPTKTTTGPKTPIAPSGTHQSGEASAPPI